MTQELLELIWVLEATTEMLPDLQQTIEEVVAGSVFRTDELPQPTLGERQAPGEMSEQREIEL